MINEVDCNEVKETSRSGPQVEKTRNAQKAVDEFVESGMDACSISWKEIDPDFDKAKQAVNYRISHTKYDRIGDAAVQDLAMRSNRAKGEIYIVHLNRIGDGK